MTDIQSQLEQLKTEDYQQDQTRLCTMMAFLIGVDWQKCGFYYEQDKVLYEELNANKSCVIIRALCRIRTNLILHFSETENEIRYNLCNIDRQDRFREDVKVLHKNDVDIIKVNYHVNQYLADLNKLIAQRINDVKGIFPDWVRWDYIRPLFLMPKGQNEKEISARSKEYLANKNCYPYQMYINWIPVEEGNILINDRKFVKVLYSQHGDVFTDMSKPSRKISMSLSMTMRPYSLWLTAKTAIRSSWHQSSSSSTRTLYRKYRKSFYMMMSILRTHGGI